MPVQRVTGVRLLVVDTTQPLEPQERAILALAADGYSPNGPCVAMEGGRVLYMFTRSAWELPDG